MPKPACISELHYGLNVWLACFREAFDVWLPAFDTHLQMQPEMLCHDGRGTAKGDDHEEQ